MVTKRMTENANKVAYLVKTYPDKKLEEIISLLQMPSININTALWAAQELGFIAAADEETHLIELLKIPKVQDWDFGDIVRELEAMLIFAFEQSAKNQVNFEENELDEWVMGYAPMDFLIAMKHLMEAGKIVSYDIDDPQLDKKGRPMLDKDKAPVINTYTFYSLPGDAANKWGQKRFKKNPLEAAKEEK